jgi:hypothetical protein
MGVSTTWPEISTITGIFAVCISVAMSLIFNFRFAWRRWKVRKLTETQPKEWTIYLHEMSNTRELLVLKVDKHGNPVASAKYHQLVKGKYKKAPQEFVNPEYIKEQEIQSIREEIKLAFETIFNGRPVTDPGNSNIYIIKK